MPLERGQLLQQAFAHAQNTFQQINENKRAEQLFQLQKKKMEAAAEEAKMQRESLEQGVQGLQQAFGTPIGEMQFTDAAATEAPGGIGPPVQQAPSTQFTEQDQQQAVLEAGLNFLRSNQDDLGRKIVESTLFPDPTKSQAALLANLEKTKAETQRIQADTLNKRILTERSKLELQSDQEFLGARGEMASMLTAQAQEAESPEVKQRLALQAQMLQGADSPEAAQRVLTDVVGIEPNLYRSLRRHGVDPIEAFQTSLELEVAAEGKKAAIKSKFREQSLSNAYEIRAKSMFDKTTSELNPFEADAVAKAVTEDRRRERIESELDKPFGSSQVTTLNALQDIISQGESIRDLLDPSLVGNLRGPLNQLAERAGLADPRFTKINTALRLMQEQFGRLQSQGAITDEELANFRNLIGDVQTNAATLPQKLGLMLNFLEQRRNRFVKLGTTAKRDVGEVLREETETIRQESQPRREAQPTGRLSEPPTPEALKEGESILENLGIPLQ